MTFAVVKLFPADWKTAVPWLVTVFTFSGTWCVLRTVHAAARRVRRWWRPGSFTIALSGGTKTTIRLDHKGAPTTYSADGRIVQVLGNREVNPAEQLFRCQLQFKGTEGGWTTTLHDDDWCHIVLAELGSGHIFVRRGTQGHSVDVSDRGCILEYTIRSHPPVKAGKAYTRRFKVVFADPDNRKTLVVTEEQS